jgi:hypothetical protein
MVPIPPAGDHGVEPQPAQPGTAMTVRPVALVVAALVLALLPAAASGQNITLKTVPIPTGEQFLLFPTRSLGMGSVAIAADDSLAAPFANPARRLDGDRARVFATPTFYGEANRWVGGRSLPIAALFAGDRFHGGLAVATQQVRDRQRGWFFPAPPPGGSNLTGDARPNTYVFGTVGGRLSEATSVGASFFHASLSAVDGVNMLYGRATGIEQSGRLTEARFGIAHDLGGDRAIEATITNTRLDMRHDVHYTDVIWEDEQWTSPPTFVQWQERNDDHTITWGTRLRFSQPLDESSRFGLILAGSTKAHPKIPNYNIVDIPRDPGNSAVFNIGAGVSRTEAGATVAMELILEPGRSHTWAFADTAVTLPSGAILQAGDLTVDNQFRFLNWVVGLGFERETDRIGYQLGLRVRQINYTLDQEHFLAEVRRETRESWAEWSPSWGVVTRFGGMELRYAGRFTARGWPDMGWWGGDTIVAVPDAGVDFVVGPTGPVNIPSFRVTTHRFTLSVPFGR